MGPLRVDDGFDDKFGAFASNALAQGYSLGDVQAFKEQAREMHNRELLARRSMASVAEEPQRKGNVLTNLLPVVGGALGAVGGSFVAPVAGTVAGGAAGSALGEALRQRLTGEDVSLKKIGTEGAFGAVPGVFKAGKAGIQAVKAGRAARTVPSSPSELSFAKLPVPDKPSRLSRMSTNATKRASGLKSDPGVGGIERADEAAKAFQRLGITGTPSAQLRKINEVMSSHGAKVDEILSKNPIKLDGKAVKAQVERAIKDPLKYAELDLSTPGSQRALTAHLSKFSQAKTAKEVNDYVKTLNKVAAKANDKIQRGATLTDKESAALAAKKAGDDVLSQYPEIKPFKKDMATLFNRNAEVTRQSEKTAGVPILGVKSNFISQGIAKGYGGAAKGLEATSQALKSTPVQTGKKLGGALTYQALTRAVVPPLISGPSYDETNPTTQSTASPMMDTTMIPASSSNIPPFNNGAEQNASMTDFSSPQTALPGAGQAAQFYEGGIRAMQAGDIKAAEMLMSFAEQAAKFEQMMAPPEPKPLSTAAAKDIANAQTGLDSLQIMRSELQRDPSVQGKSSIPGRLLGGLSGKVLGTGQYEAAREQAIDVIARMRTGAQINDSEAKRFTAMLPQPFEDQQSAAQKLAQLERMFTIVADRNNTGTMGFPSDPSQVSF